MIPDSLHQIWFDWGKPKPPLDAQLSIQKWGSLHPQWLHKLWSWREARAYVRTHYDTEVAELLDTLPYPIQRCDFFRLLVLYQEGGFYVDIDVHPEACIAPLRDYAIVLSVMCALPAHTAVNLYDLPPSSASASLLALSTSALFAYN